jgi:hypothetical protein
MDWTGDLLALFPRRDAAARQGVIMSQPKISEELRKMELEPLLPVEKKLILWSVSLGVVLIVVLAWVSHTFFPV